MASWPLTVQADASTPSASKVASSSETAFEVNRNSSQLAENISLKTEVRKFPVLEASSFDNHAHENASEDIDRKLTTEQIQKLGLQSWAEQGHSIFLNYELPYSSSFKTYVFTLEGEMERITSMATFDVNLNKIDELRVAYDEIAESWLRVKSRISKNKIEVRTFVESSGKTVIKTKIYKINRSGRILDISTNKKALNRR